MCWCVHRLFSGSIDSGISRNKVKACANNIAKLLHVQGQPKALQVAVTTEHMTRHSLTHKRLKWLSLNQQSIIYC